jgi:hypothetical protein
MQACNFARDKPVSTEFFLFDERDWFYISLSFFGKTLENDALKNAWSSILLQGHLHTVFVSLAHNLFLPASDG